MFQRLVGFRDTYLFSQNPVFAKWFPMCIDWLKEKLGDFTIYGAHSGSVEG